jgi:N-dimethylarginine dimethylaminohydrolase
MYGVNSECGRIEDVLLHMPRPVIQSVRNPSSVCHEDHINYNAIKREFEHLAKHYIEVGISVNFLDPPSGISDRSLLNMMYTRDLVFMTPEGAVIANMRYPIRRDEPDAVIRFMQNRDIPVSLKVSGEGTFEGADALWIRKNFVLVGVGNRTNPQGFSQLKKLLNTLAIECEAVALPKGIQHLLGAVQIVDDEIALVRSQVMSKGILQLLERFEYRIIEVPEHPEVSKKQAMNIVTIRPKCIIMPDDTPEIEALYAENGLKIVAKVPIAELRKGAGGLACATAILRRS